MNRSYYKTIYSFAPTDFLKEMTNKKAKELAATLGIMSDKDHLDEAGGILDAYTERKNENPLRSEIIIKTSCIFFHKEIINFSFTVRIKV